MQSIIGTDQIRGRFNEEITYSLAFKVAYALGLTLENNNPILIGRDTRVGGDILLQAIKKGINASGEKIYKSWYMTCPSYYFLQTIENFQEIYSDNCRFCMRPSGTET